MTTLIEIRTSSGIVGRCDAKCHDAEHPQCDCICGGKNHGAGLEQARENTRELGEQWIERWEQEHPGQRGLLTDEVRQRGLFE